MTIILASNSATRKAMLAGAGVGFEVSPARIDERGLEARMAGAPPAKVALALARAKALAVSGAVSGTVSAPGRLVLGGDSLVVAGGRRFDKPQDRNEAAEHLRFFSGRVMELHSAAALARDGGIVWEHCALARLHVRALSDGFISAYLDAEWPDVGQSVGVFRIEALGVQLFETIEGDYFTILGMPLLAVLGALREFGELPR